MNWQNRMVLRILVTVAQLLASDEWKKEVDSLAAHMHCNIPKLES